VTNKVPEYLKRQITRRQAIKAGGTTALGLTFAKPLIRTIYPKPAFANYVVGGGSAPPPTGNSLAPPFDRGPFDTGATGNSAANLFGSFRRNGGPKQFRYFIGTETPGRLIMDFVPFTAGPGNDFTILTNSQAWGPLADTALFEFFLNGVLQPSFTASLAPD